MLFLASTKSVVKLISDKGRGARKGEKCARRARTDVSESREWLHAPVVPADKYLYEHSRVDVTRTVRAYTRVYLFRRREGRKKGRKRRGFTFPREKRHGISYAEFALTRPRDVVSFPQNGEPSPLHPMPPSANNRANMLNTIARANSPPRHLQFSRSATRHRKSSVTPRVIPSYEEALIHGEAGRTFLIFIRRSPT